MNYVLFIFTSPSDKVPHKLYYLNGHVWTEEPEEAFIFKTLDEAYKMQQKLKKFDTQIEKFEK